MTEAFGVSRENMLSSGFWPEKGASMRGFRNPLDFLRFAKFVQKTGEFRPRFGEGGAELDPNFQQLIMYAVIINNKGDLLLYERAREGHGEKRLAGRASIGIGGHMERGDKNIIRSLYRELAEEIGIWEDGREVDTAKTKRGMKDFARVSVIGIIKDDKSEAGEDHFGVLCFVAPKKEGIELKVRTGKESKTSKYVGDNEFLRLANSRIINPEPWTAKVFASISSVGVKG